MIVNKTTKLPFKKKCMFLQILIFLFISIVFIRDIIPPRNIRCVIIIVIWASDSTTCWVCLSLLIGNLIFGAFVADTFDTDAFDSGPFDPNTFEVKAFAYDLVCFDRPIDLGCQHFVV